MKACDIQPPNHTNASSITRRQSLGLITAALLLPSCAAKALNPIRIGSTTSAKNTAIAEIYALALERANIPVERHMALGSAQYAMSALQRGDIDLYPDYIRTKASDPHRFSPEPAGTALYAALKPMYERRYGVTWLTPAPVNDAACLVTSQYAAEAYWLLTLTKCADIAGQLRLAATPAFVAKGGPLSGLQSCSKKFKFKKLLICEPGSQYDALGRGDADVATGFATDSNIAEQQLIVLRDDKGLWPRYNVAPISRLAAIRSHPRVRPILNRISKTLTQFAVQQLDMRLDDLSMDPHDAAERFLRAHSTAPR